ncbi:DUF3667 domain-containing protein [Dawidia soli]|uniref:DUF3667 domain-containing protein n=1 Tax=Dawidia soli TaxID=2782352 RepID=A0AAP2GG01_9BACT|nr:DUF3667 domain-containing protein [Dawidia soli]MBT1690004.1 DUF3667 domain-containing protein [Dawidia soli]
MTCKNCHAPAPGAYCAACGQQTHIHRVTMGHLAHEVSHALTHADKGFLLLIKELITRPGIVAREYLNGKRKKYFNPFTFLVITSALYAYISYKTGYSNAMVASDAPSSNRSPYYQEVIEIVVQNGKLLMLILIVPLFATLSWLFSIRSRFNLAENFVLQAFVVGQINIVRVLLFIPAFLLAPTTIHWNVYVYEACFALYLTVTYRQFFRNKWIFAFLKAIAVYFLFIVLYWVVIIVFVALRHAVNH